MQITITPVQYRCGRSVNVWILWLLLATFPSFLFANTVPYTTGWETGDDGWTIGGTNPSWALGAPSGGGINAAATGTNAWVTNLTGDYNNSELSYLISPRFDFSNLPVDPIIQFSLNHQTEVNFDGGWVEVSTDSTNWTKVGPDVTGANWYNNTTQGWWDNLSTGWITASSVLSGTVGQSTVWVRFVLSSDGGINREGLGIDDFSLMLPPSEDLGVIAITGPASGCGLSTTEVVSIIVENFGIDAQTGFSVAYQINGNIPVVETFNGLLEPDSTTLYTFTTPANLFATGAYNLKTWTDVVGDGDTTNDTLSTTLENAFSASFPFVEDFENFTICGNTSGCLVDCSASVVNGWVQDHDTDNDDWRVTNGPTPSTTTGPNVDHNPGSASGKYLFTEASGSCNFQTSNLISPCLNISNLANPYVAFYFHMYGDDMGGLNLDISTDGTATWTNLWSQSGQVQTSNNDPWERVQVNLAGYGGIVHLRFQGVTGNGFNSDMAIDDIKVYDRPPIDVFTRQILSPVGGTCNPSDSALVKISFGNLSDTAVFDIPLAYSINGDPAIYEIYNDTLQPEEEVVYNFSTPADLSGTGTYTIQTWTEFANDGDATNDTATVILDNIQPVNTFPFFTGWENAGAEGWEAQGASSSWELGAPNGFVINSAASGVNAWVTNLSGPYTPQESSTLVSPCFNFSSLVVDPTVRFAVNWDIETFFDAGRLEVSTDGGASWSTLGSMGTGINWYNASSGWEGSSGGWVVAEHELTGVAGEEQVRFRFIITSDFSVENEGLAIDDFEILPPPANNAEISGQGEYTQIPITQANIALKSKVRNLGTNTLYSVNVDFEVYNTNNSLIYTGVGTLDSLVVGDSAFISPSTIFAPPTTGSYYAQYVVASAVSDDDPADNTFVSSFFEISTAVYARDDGNLGTASGIGVGIGGNDDAELGQSFEIVVADTLASVTFYLETPPAGDVIYANIYDTHPNGSPNDVVATTTSYTITASDAANGVLQTLPIAGGPTGLAPGKYVITLVEPGESISVYSMANIFTPKTTWVTWFFNPNGPNVWSNLEEFGFQLCLYIRANFGGTTAAQEIEQLTHFELFPNPTKDYVNLLLELEESKTTTIAILDVMGRVLYQSVHEPTPTLQIALDLSDYPSGVYFIRAQIDGQIAVRRLVVGD